MSLWYQRRKSSLWRQHQESRKLKKIARVALFVVVVFLLIVGAERILTVKKFLEAPQSKILGLKTESNISDFNRLNFLLKTKPLLLASLSQDDQSLTVLALPDNLYLETAGGEKALPLGSLYQKAESENPGLGAKILTETIKNTLAIPIDGYLEISDIRYQVSEEEVKKLKQQISDLTLVTKILEMPNFFSQNLKTSLSPGEILNVWWRLRQVRPGKIRYLEFDKQSLTQKVLLPEGGEGEMPDTARVDDFISKIFSDAKLKKENLKIEILNATETAGLAQRVGRMVTNLGGDVVNIGNYPGKVQKSFISSTSEKNNLNGFILTSQTQKNSYSARRLSSIFSYEVKEGTLFEQRGDLVIVVTQ